jgi:Fe-Mn family superoxide dismutase
MFLKKIGMKYEEQKFIIPKLKGISEKNIEEHLKLYSGYVKQTNLVIEKINELSTDVEKNAGLLSGLRRRFSFEFNGMRNHENYFKNLEDGANNLAEDSSLKVAIDAQFGNFENWLTQFKEIAMTRGIGWAMLYYDPQNQNLINAWVDEQHLGQLNGLPLILGVDMWEHAFVADYQPSGKKQYVEDFFVNLNWKKVEENFNQAVS